MRNFIPFLIIFLTLYSMSFGLDNEEYIIETRLFKGSNNYNLSEHDIVVSSFLGPFVFPIHPKEVQKENDVISNFELELSQIFQTQNITHIATGKIFWDGKKKPITEWISQGANTFPIYISPKKVTGNGIKLEIEISRNKDNKFLTKNISVSDENKREVSDIPAIYLSSKRSEEKILLQTRLNLKFGVPIVLGFPSNGSMYFLSLFISKRGIVPKFEKVYSPDDIRGFISSPPEPIVRIIPVYPKECKENGIEGTVAVRVRTNVAGDVKKVRIFMSAHPELDKAALAAIKQWKFKPNMRRKKPIKSHFFMTVNFKLNRKVQEKNPEQFDEINTKIN